ncbi:hypothetical protein T10_13577 [Trichinella papuae]|uniref:Uncharacterized protein n=1 Tax=Trichinella papuae TaxID=268474 RepID=A0A0V1MB74_9BILA|nr:hypothetical protein T10_13577 [Trichinella papuae]
MKNARWTLPSYSTTAFIGTVGAGAYWSRTVKAFSTPLRGRSYHMEEQQAQNKNWAKRLSNLPKHCQDQEIPDQLKTSKSEEDFLVCQSASKHILVFATCSRFRLLVTRKASGMDGTFKIVPQWY